MNDVSSGFRQVFAYCIDCKTLKGKKTCFKFVCFLLKERSNKLALNSTSIELQPSLKNDFFDSDETQRLNRFQLNKKELNSD